MKLKPFNLEEALNGAKVVTRDGREVKQLQKFITFDKMKLYGVIDEQVYRWDENGKNLFAHRIEYDLFIDVEPQRVWVNVYRDGNKIWIGNPHLSKDEAIANVAITCTYIKTIEITDEI